MENLVAARAVYCLETPRRSSSNELARPRRTDRWRPDPRTVARLRLQALSQRELTEEKPGFPSIARQGVYGAHVELASEVSPLVIRATRMTISTRPRKVEGVLSRLLRWLFPPQVMIEG
jgi:hypothetical protein